MGKDIYICSTFRAAPCMRYICERIKTISLPNTQQKKIKLLKKICSNYVNFIIMSATRMKCELSGFSFLEVRLVPKLLPKRI